MASNNPACQQVAHAIKQAHALDPFQRCTVVVPHRAVTLDVLRAVSVAGGAVNLRLTTLTDLAREILDSAGALVGQEPLSRAMIQDAVTKELTQNPRCFAKVADQVATVTALTDACVSLSRAAHLPTSGLPTITADTIDIYRSIQPSLQGTITTHATFQQATALLSESQELQQDLGHLILMELPPQRDPAAHEFLSLLQKLAKTTVPLPEPTSTETTSHIDRLISLTDPLEEAQCAVELIAEELASGSTGHRIGVFFPQVSPYMGTVTALLDEAGIAYSSPGLASLAAHPVARAFRRLGGSDPDALDLRDILDAHWEGALAPSLGSGGATSERRVPSSARLERAFVIAIQKNLNDGGESEDPSLRISEHEREDWHALCRARDELIALLRDVDSAPSWNASIDAMKALCTRVLADHGTERRRVRHAITSALTSLLRAEDDPSPDRERLVALVMSTLASRTPRRGSLKQGVVVGTFASAVSRDLDHVFILGMADGIAPSPSGIDPIFPDDVREKLGGGFVTTLEIRQNQELDFRHAVRAGRRVTVTAPRGRLRQSGKLSPSPWLGDLTPTHVLDSPLAGAAGGYGSSVPTASTQDRAWYRALLTAGSSAPASDRTESLPSHAQRAREIRRDRHEGAFTRFTGNISSLSPRHRILTNDDAVPAVGPETTGHSPQPGSAGHSAATSEVQPTSASAIELWAKEPYGYFLERVLGAEILTYPDAEDTISRADFGTVVHSVLETVVNELIAEGAVPSDARVNEILEEALASVERSVWLPAQWAYDRTRAAAMVTSVVAELRSATESSNGWVPVAAESAFGMHEESSHPALSITLDGGTLRVRGKVDRVDRHGADLRVVDYKTGSPSAYSSIRSEATTRAEANPTAGGTRFQLPIYALHALAHLQEFTGEPDNAQVTATYQFIRSAEEKDIKITWSPEVEREVRTHLSRITSAIEAGYFPLQATPAPRDNRETWYTRMGQRDAERLTRALAKNEVVRRATLVSADLEM